MDPSGANPRRVVVVDNDPVTRTGYSSLLAGHPAIEVVAAIDHDAALEWQDEWDRVDVAVVDASDPRREGDKFPGVAVVQTLRARRSRDETLIIVLTGQFLHQGLRRRMREAGADFFYGRDEGMGEEELAAVVLRPDEHRRLEAMPIDLPAELGITTLTDVNQVLASLSEPSIFRALEPDARKKSDTHGDRSRWWNKVRGLASGPRGLKPVNSSGDVALDKDLPSIPQLRKFLRAMTRPTEPGQE